MPLSTEGGNPEGLHPDEELIARHVGDFAIDDADRTTEGGKTTARVDGVLAHPKVAKREYACADCGRTIEEGSVYLYVNAFYPRRVCEDHAS